MMEHAPMRWPSFGHRGNPYAPRPPEFDNPAFPLFDPTIDEPHHRTIPYINLDA